MKVRELCGAELDYWTAKAVNLDVTMSIGFVCFLDTTPRCRDYGIPSIGVFDWNPSSNWQLCGEFIEKFNISLKYCHNDAADPPFWVAMIELSSVGSLKPQEAICRVVVTSVFGDEVDEIK